MITSHKAPKAGSCEHTHTNNLRICGLDFRSKAHEVIFNARMGMDARDFNILAKITAGHMDI